MLKIAIWNLKGGTGKSCTTQNLGAELAAAKLKTALVDLDGQRTLSFSLGMDGAEPTVLDWLQGKAEPLPTDLKNLALVPGDIGMFQLSADKDLIASSLKGLIGFDVCLMDCPPSLGLASVQAVLNADRVLMPTLTEPASLKGISEAVQLIRNERPDIPIEVLRTRYKSRLVLSREADDLLIEGAEDFGYRLLHTTIPENIAIAESVAQQVPVKEYDGKSIGANAYKSLAREVKKIWGLGK
ncbi:ParA family protein [Pseudanabaena sp. FACHB-2040]|uniref:ParA family protein n=1 Tax=Pseudanabaena sp. FACHB-2040 TaxID=2692859 RepID=UPI001682441C|nr:ParA family protein [Pseudanabaena sp. FACHB-2040]MBD2261116.1 ParA family protein [Pseudanabaena sp. FACHB-2040]